VEVVLRVLAEARYAWILDHLRVKGLITTEEICTGIRVSGQTARRDLERLEDEGQLRRVYGGATLIDGRDEPSIRNLQGKNTAEKRAIGALAASLVQDGEMISLGRGTTTLEVARHLREYRELTVLASSIPIAMEMLEKEHTNVYLTGGLLSVGEMVLSGHLAEETLRQFFVDKVFLGADGVTLAEGVTDYTISESRIHRLMVERARETILVCDHSKLGRVSFTSVVPITSVTKLITDSGADEKTLKEFRDKVSEVLVAEVAKTRSKAEEEQ
jgi:DeoR/GlpR family transcriptional regulator of sugar metabolism